MLALRMNEFYYSYLFTTMVSSRAIIFKQKMHQDLETVDLGNLAGRFVNVSSFRIVDWESERNTEMLQDLEANAPGATMQIGGKNGTNDITIEASSLQTKFRTSERVKLS